MNRTLVLILVVAACSRATAGKSTSPHPAPSSHPAPDSLPVVPAPHPADVHFISGMIDHHQQALVMAAWAEDSVHGASQGLRTLADRITVSQKDEIATAQRWLDEHHAQRMSHDMLMPGMLTAEQLSQLDRGRGPEFDRLFLKLMIQHHEGALTMVNELLSAPGAGQDGFVFQFAADVHADQSAEIDRMRRLLAALLIGGTTP